MLTTLLLSLLTKYLNFVCPLIATTPRHLHTHILLLQHLLVVVPVRISQLRQLGPVVKSITEHADKMVVQAFISSWLDYCNSLLCGIAGNLLQKLQSVQNAAARLITRTGIREHITPSVLRELHWLPVRQRIDFKLSLIHI